MSEQDPANENLTAPEITKSGNNNKKVIRDVDHVLEICKKWGMSNPNDTRHWMQEIDEEINRIVDIEIKKHVELLRKQK